MFDNEGIPEEMWRLLEKLEVAHVKSEILEIVGAKKNNGRFLVRFILTRGNATVTALCKHSLFEPIVFLL